MALKTYQLLVIKYILFHFTFSWNYCCQKISNNLTITNFFKSFTKVIRKSFKLHSKTKEKPKNYLVTSQINTCINSGKVLFSVCRLQSSVGRIIFRRVDKKFVKNNKIVRSKREDQKIIIFCSWKILPPIYNCWIYVYTQTTWRLRKWICHHYYVLLSSKIKPRGGYY